MPAGHAAGIEAHAVLLDVLPPLPVVPVYDRCALVRRLLLLLVVPEFLPGRAVAVLGRQARFQIDGSHVHHMERVLVLEGYVRDEPRVHDYHFAQVAEFADAQDDGAFLQPRDLVVREGFCELAHFVVAVREGFFVEEVGRAAGGLVGAGDGGVGVRGGLGEGEEEFVFVVAADAGGVEAVREGDDAGRVGACLC